MHAQNNNNSLYISIFIINVICCGEISVQSALIVDGGRFACVAESLVDYPWEEIPHPPLAGGGHVNATDRSTLQESHFSSNIAHNEFL